MDPLSIGATAASLTVASTKVRTRKASVKFNEYVSNTTKIVYIRSPLRFTRTLKRRKAVMKTSNVLVMRCAISLT